MRVEVGTHRPSDLIAVAAAMREADRREAAAMGACSPWDAVERSVRLSYEVWAGRVDDIPACLFGLGCGSILGRTARPWLLGTDAVERNGVAFLRRNRGMVADWRERYAVLENWVDARHAESIRWLKWLGFEIHEAEPFGAFGFPFHRFDIRR